MYPQMIRPDTVGWQKNLGLHCLDWSQTQRENLHTLINSPKDIPVLLSLDLSEPDGLSQYLQGEGGFTDVFIAGTGADAAAIYESMEMLLARSAAVNFIDGEVDLKIRSKNAHYVTRHQICGKNVPWHMTNTSEPHADDMLVQASKPVSFDWMVGNMRPSECHPNDGRSRIRPTVWVVLCVRRVRRIYLMSNVLQLPLNKLLNQVMGLSNLH